MDSFKVLAKGDVLVLDIEYASQTGSRRYVGRSVVRAWTVDELPKGEPSHEIPNEFFPPGTEPVQHMAFPKLNKAVSVKNSRYYRNALKNGELWPADIATAKAVDVEFDASFGGEFGFNTK